MSMCSGKIYCEIYRDKKYCKTPSKAADNYHECDCRHAVTLCDTDIGCGFDNICPIIKESEKTK